MIFITRYSSSRKPCAVRGMRRRGLFSPSAHPRETVFSGLQLKDDAIPMTFDHGRELLEWLKPLPAYIV